MQEGRRHDSPLVVVELRHRDHHRPVARQLVGQDGREEVAQAVRKLAHDPVVPTLEGAIAWFAVEALRGQVVPPSLVQYAAHVSAGPLRVQRPGDSGQLFVSVTYGSYEAARTAGNEYEQCKRKQYVFVCNNRGISWTHWSGHRGHLRPYSHIFRGIQRKRRRRK